MFSKQEVLRMLRKNSADWCSHLSHLTVEQLANVEERVGEIRSELEVTVGRLSEASSLVQTELERRKNQEVRVERKQRRSQSKISLRDFLKRPSADVDKRLEHLSLCSKRGAALTLRRLNFRVACEPHDTRMVNEARAFFQQGIEPDPPMWDLHYVEDGERSAGFGWERPFLDEVFVLDPGGP